MELKFNSIAEIRKALNDDGSFWFSPNAMRAFETEFPEDRVYAGRIFIASHMPPSGTRVYGVHYVQRTERRLTITDANAILADAPTDLETARAVAAFLAAQELPEMSDYDENKRISDRVETFLEMMTG